MQFFGTAHGWTGIFTAIKIIELGKEVWLIGWHVNFILAATVTHMLTAHILLHSDVRHLLLHAAEAARIIPGAMAAHALPSAWLSTTWAFTQGKPTDDAWRGNLSNSLRPLICSIFIIQGNLALPILSLHAEKVARARQHFMKHTHDASEHLWRHILVDLGIIFIWKRSPWCAKYVVRKTHNFILIVFPREECLSRRIVHALLDSTLHAHNRLRTPKVFFCLEWHVAQQDSDVLSLHYTIIVKVIPISQNKRFKVHRRISFVVVEEVRG